VTSAATLHLDACTPNFKTQEHFNDFADVWVKDAVEEYPEVVDGSFALPDKPGLGVTPREDFIADHPRRQVRFNHFEEDCQKRQAT
jgi:galactonate dehydratase